MQTNKQQFSITSVTRHQCSSSSCTRKQCEQLPQLVLSKACGFHSSRLKAGRTLNFNFILDLLDFSNAKKDVHQPRAILSSHTMFQMWAFCRSIEIPCIMLLISHPPLIELAQFYLQSLNGAETYQTIISIHLFNQSVSKKLHHTRITKWHQ